MHGQAQFLPHHIAARVARQLEVVDTRHDTRQVVVRLKRRLWLSTNDRERWLQGSKAADRQTRRTGQPL